MLSLDQVRSLESRVEKALAYIDELTEENAALRERLGGYESRIKDLEVLVRDFQQDQGRIEEGILSALEKLNAFEGASSPAKARGAEADVQGAKARPSEGPSRGKNAAAPVETASVEIDETDEIIVTDEIIEESLEEEEGEAASEPAKPSGELDIF